MQMTIQRRLRNACARAMIVVALALLSCLGAVHARAEADGMLRVKLARLGSPSVIEMTADCDYTLTGDRALRIPAGTKLTVAAQNGGLTLSANGTTVDAGASAILTRAASGSVGAQFLTPALSNRFCGDLQFAASGDVITTVLRIYVEDYLYGVVGYEMAPSSGLEALKAQAVVARNYALRQKAARTGAAYDLTDSGDALSFRGYSGASEYADVLRAVDATRGQALYYGGSPATCYFCDSNGGQIESAANALGRPAALQRGPRRPLRPGGRRREKDCLDPKGRPGAGAGAGAGAWTPWRRPAEALAADADLAHRDHRHHPRRGPLRRAQPPLCQPELPAGLTWPTGEGTRRGPGPGGDPHLRGPGGLVRPVHQRRRQRDRLALGDRPRLRDHVPAQRLRPGHEPARGPGDGQEGLHLRRDPGILLSRHHARHAGAADDDAARRPGSPSPRPG